MQDLTDRRFLGLLEAAPDAMVCVEGDGRIALVNAQAERLFGYHREELIGQQVEILVPEIMRGGHPTRRAGYVADPRPRPMGGGAELAGRRRDGSTFPAEISLSAIDSENGILVTAAVRDATERLANQAERERLRTEADRDRVERQVQQSQRLESLGQLAGGVAHDFNNLLGVISSYAAFVAAEAERQGPGESWEAIRADIEQVMRAADRAAGLTHQLLSFARREVVQPRVLNLNETVASVEQLLRRTLGEHIELMTVLASDLWPALADPGQMEQVLVNLAVNARDAMPAGGKLTIETANTDVDEACSADRGGPAAGRYAAVKVSDTGAGMPPEVIDRAFEPRPPCSPS
jgi:PAS domain S-box-containing protein